MSNIAGKIGDLLRSLSGDPRRHGYTSAVILAAGSSTRMGEGVSKQCFEISGIPVAARSLLAFEKSDLIREIIVVAKEDEIPLYDKYKKKYSLSKLKTAVAGGKTRRQSALIGTENVSKNTEYVAIHDAARCLVTTDMIDRVCRAAYRCKAATAAAKVSDTVKISDEKGFIKKTLDRESVWLAQTPQVFSLPLYAAAAYDADEKGFECTDDNMLIERISNPVKLVDCGRENIKITVPEDLKTAEMIINMRNSKESDKMRIGHGYDVHRLVEGGKLILGGTEIPFGKGLSGHSDADVLCHAVADALFGAAALGDIGRHFPDTAPEYAGADSLKLLERTGEILAENGYETVNADATVIAEAPKISPYVEKMRENIAYALHVPKDRISVKATTEEKLGFTGAGLGIAAHAVCLIKKKTE